MRNLFNTIYQSISNFPHRRLGDIQYICNFSLGKLGIVFYFFEYVVIDYFYARIFPSIFPYHVLCVIFMSSKKKMFGIDTDWIIAFMTYQHSFRNNTIMEFPRKSMNRYIFSVYRNLSILSSSLQVTLPTLVRFYNRIPKSLRWSNIGILVFSSIIHMEKYNTFSEKSQDYLIHNYL